MIQIILAVVSILMHKGVIKLEQKKLWLKWLVLAVAILFTVLNIMSYSWGQGGNDFHLPSIPDTPGVTDESVTTTATTPYGAEECVGQDFNSIKNELSSAGFTSIKVEKIEDLKSTEADKLNTIESVSIGGMVEFSKGQEFDRSDEVVILYHGYAKCEVKLHVDFIPNLMFSKYDVNLLLNGIEEGTLPHGEDKDFEFNIEPGEYILTFESDESSSVKGEVSLTVDCDLEASYKISCSSDKISVETLYVDRLAELADGEVKLDVPASEYKFENYTEVETALKALGFTNIKHNVLYDIVIGWTDEGEVDSVSIDGNTDFKRGDVFASDSEIIITYHMKEENDPNKPTESTAESTETPDTTEEPDDSKPVFYSTNDYETAKEGNTGVFAYRDRGNSYDIYWIVDFDEGYVYYFTEGNGESFCDRLKIESGTLNDKITITYHDGGDTWSYRLHFKYVNHPETLIMNDQNGFDWEYSTTDLSDALNLKATKTVKDY